MTTEAEENPVKITITHSCFLPFEPFRLAWASSFSPETRIAVSSFYKSQQNFLKLIKLVGPSAINESGVQIPYPICDLKFAPNGSPDSNDKLISCGDNLKLWQVQPNNLQLLSDIQLSPEKMPITSLDWSIFQENLVLVGGTDGAATAVDISCSQIAARIIAHDHPIHDINFCAGTPTFITASFDGSLRFFDLRDLQSSFIYYQTAMPIARCEVSPFDSNYIASFSKDSPAVSIVDARHPGVPAYICEYQDSPVTCMGWSKITPNLIFWSNTTNSLLVSSLGNSMSPPARIVQSTTDPIECFSIGSGTLAQSLGKKVDVLQYTPTEINQSLPLSMMLDS